MRSVRSRGSNNDDPEGLWKDWKELESWCIFVGMFLMPWLCVICHCFWDSIKTRCRKCYNTCCEPQPIARNNNNATRYRTKRSNISTISANIRQPSRRPPSPSAPPKSEIKEGLVDQLPRSKALEDPCTGRSKYFF